MEMVIDIPDKVYGLLKYFESALKADVPNKDERVSEALIRAVLNGIPLPKGHGRLIDVEDIMYECNTARIRAGDSFVTRTYVDNIPTIIEARE